MAVLMVVSVTAGVAFVGGAGAQQTGNAGNAAVTFPDQSTDDTTVTVESVVVPEGGFVAIHDSTLLDGNVVGSVVGVSEYLGPGLHEDVEVTLFDVPGAEFNQTALNESQSLIAMPHLDTNSNQTYDFVATDGAADGPYVANGSAVTEAANVTVEPDDGGNVTTESFEVSNLTAPSVVERGETVTVNATVTNPGEASATETVEFRFDGGVFATETVELDGGESTTVSFSIDTASVESGQYFHGVYTDARGEPAQLRIVDEIESFDVANLSAPATATVGDEVTVTANVTNPNDFTIAQEVEFRFDGDVVAAQDVEIDAEGATVVEFQVGTEGIEPGTYIHEVFTREFGQSALITLEAGDGEPPEDTPEPPTDTPTPTDPPEETPEPPTDTPNVTESPEDTPEPPTDTNEDDQ
jgi:hypothetical protein